VLSHRPIGTALAMLHVILTHPCVSLQPNCTLVIIDFLVRHGWLTPDMAGYTQLVAALRAPGAV
jgi:hypothetical protein